MYNKKKLIQFYVLIILIILTGTFAITSIMTGNVICGHIASSNATTNGLALHYVEENRISVMIAVTMSVGIWQLVMGLLGLGNLSVYLSDQLVKG